MGDEEAQPVIETLPDGTCVERHPADDEHPEGKLVLIHDPAKSPLRMKFNAALEDNRAAHQDIRQKHRDDLARKQAAEDAKGVPKEKRGF